MIVETSPMIPLDLGIALRTLTARFTRDGEQTGTFKYGLLLGANRELFAVLPAFDGRTATTFVVASVVDNGDWLLLAFDPTAPRRVEASYAVITQDVTLTVDFTEGQAGGGLPAALSARVQLDLAPAAREVLAVEARPDGTWTVAGYGLTDAQGEVELDLRVTGSGRVYALAVDDWGLLFQPGLAVAVGQVVRPTSFRGWLYRITQAGTLPATEPTWWDSSQPGPQDLGTARAEAVRYYQPLAHGPLPVEMI